MFIMKDQMNNQMKRYIDPEGPQAQKLLSLGVGMCHRPGALMCSLTWELSESHRLEVFMEAASDRQSLAPRE